MIRRPILVLALCLLGFAAPARSAVPVCTVCDAWNAPQTPFPVYGNTYYVGVHGLSSLLVDTGKGLVLIDGDLPQSPPLIEANIKALGFKLSDIKLILNSHAHFDHAGGLAELQRLTGAPVEASAWSAGVLSDGGMGKEDPQYGLNANIDPVKNVRVVKDRATVRLGSVVFTAHDTPGHTPGGTSWTWVSCESGRCLNVAYVDSLNAVSAPGYLFSKHPEVLAQFEKSFQAVTAFHCDILLTPHPDVSGLLDKWQKREQGATPDPFVDSSGCRTLVERSRKTLADRLAKESADAVK